MGARYRLEVTDLGLGVTPRDMLKMLLDWGYQVSREACQEQKTLYLTLNYLSISHSCIYLVTSSFFALCTYLLSSFIFLFIYIILFIDLLHSGVAPRVSSWRRRERRWRCRLPAVAAAAPEVVVCRQDDPHGAAGKVPRGVRRVCSQGEPGAVGAGSNARLLCRYVQDVFKIFL